MGLELKKIRALVIDADGVLFRGEEALPGVPEFFAFLRQHCIPGVIATNHSGRPASHVIDKLARMGTVVQPGQVLTSAQVTALYMPRIAPHAKRVLAIGGEALVAELEREGYCLVEQDADAVVVGIDEMLTYDKLKRASREIRKGAQFIATNADKTFPVADGVNPGAGAIIAAIHAATDVLPTVIGKPERIMFDLAVERMKAIPETTATLGDRLETDIEGGARAGLRSILVLTGVTTREMLAQSPIKPDVVFDDLNALRETWKRSLNGGS